MSHIERLLLVHDCVIVPKVGGFVLQDRPAVFMERENLFIPSLKEVVFNPTLQHNDGLLPESYMKMYGTDYNQAFRMMEDDITELKETLSRTRRISLGSVGVFLSGEEGNVVFERSEQAPFSVASYGLAEFSMPTLKSLSVEQESTEVHSPARKKRDTIYIPVSVRFIRTAVASAAAVALFLLVSTPVKDVNTSAYTASFIPSEVVAKAAAPEPEPKATIEVSAPVLEPVVTPRPAAAEPAPLVPGKGQEVKKGVVAVKKNIKYYHIVVGSFPTRKQADDFLSRIDKNKYGHAGIVERDGKVRVYAAKFTNRKEAENYMEQVRSNASYKDAWLFISR